MSISWQDGRPYVRVYDPAVGAKRRIKATEFPELPPPPRGASRQTMERWAKELEALARRVLGERRPVGGDEDADAFAGRWPKDFPRGESTNAVNTQRLRAFITDFQGRPLRGREAITRTEARAWIRGGVVPDELYHRARRWAGIRVLDSGELEAPGHPSALSTVRAMFNDALTDRLADDNPFAALGIKQSRGRKDIDRLSRDEVHALADLALELHGDFGPELQAMVLWSAYTCVRTGELFAARFSRLHGDVYELREQVNRRLRKETEPKHGSTGRIFVPEPAREAVLAKPRRLDDDLMFRTKRGRQFTQESFGYYWKPLRAAFTAGLPEAHWLRRRLAVNPDDQFDLYELRHFGASYMLNALRIEPLWIARQLRHTNTKQVIELYGHPDTDAALDAIRGAWGQNVRKLPPAWGQAGARRPARGR